MEENNEQMIERKQIVRIKKTIFMKKYKKMKFMFFFFL